MAAPKPSSNPPKPSSNPSPKPSDDAVALLLSKNGSKDSTVSLLLIDSFDVWDGDLLDVDFDDLLDFPELLEPPPPLSPLSPLPILSDCDNTALLLDGTLSSSVLLLLLLLLLPFLPFFCSSLNCVNIEPGGGGGGALPC